MGSRRRIMTMLGIGLLLVIGGLFRMTGGTSHQQPASGGDTPITMIGVHGAAVPRAIEERSRQAAVIALVTVERVEPARWNTPDGTAPANLQTSGQTTGESPLIYRPVHLRVERYLKQPQDQAMITVHQLGGQLDGVTFATSEEMVTFEEGQRAVVFLSRKHPPAAVEWGVYSAYILEGGEAVSPVDQNRVPLDALLARIGTALK